MVNFATDMIRQQGYEVVTVKLSPNMYIAIASKFKIKANSEP